MSKQPKNPFHPGEILLEEFLEPMSMTQTAEAALDLADVLGTSPKLWMNLQATYDLDRAQRARSAA